MDHRQSFGSAINDTWNMLYSKRKSGCDMLKEDGQTNFLMQMINRKILWMCAWISICISVWSFGYQKPSIIPHAIGRNLWGKAPQFFLSMICEQFPVQKIPGLSQQDTSVKASDRRKWFFLNKNIQGEASQVRNSGFSSTIIRPSFVCKL